jgi:hypothetical protein
VFRTLHDHDHDHDAQWATIGIVVSLNLSLYPIVFITIDALIVLDANFIGLLEPGRPAAARASVRV